MLRAVVISVSLLFAVWVLSLSVFRTSSPKYAFYQPGSFEPQATFSANVDYDLPEPGIGPDNPLWYFKVLRDKVWAETTLNPAKRSQLFILFADKRLIQARRLVEEGNAELGVATAQKAESYLLEASNMEVEANLAGMDTSELAHTLALSSLKHREVLEECISIVPDDAKPTLSQITDIPKQVYEKSVQRLNEKGKIPPTSEPEITETQN